MTVLIDQNISHRIIPGISFLFDELVHEKTLGWVDWNDHDIFMGSRKLQHSAVITLDEDFNKLLLSVSAGSPDKGPCGSERQPVIARESNKPGIFFFRCCVPIAMDEYTPFNGIRCRRVPYQETLRRRKLI